MKSIWLIFLAFANVLPVPLNTKIKVNNIVDEESRFEYTAGMFEGDINEPNYNPRYRVAMSSRTRMWPNGIVPFRIDAQFLASVQRMFRNTMTEVQEQLKYGSTYCIRFVERTTERDHIYIRSKTGCSSPIGRKGGEQVMSMGSGCLTRGTTIHELLHGIGFWHEHSRPDRNLYVTVNWDNIISGKETNFEQHITDSNTMGFSYDMLSIMQYGPYNFPRDRSRPTLYPRQQGQIMGQRRGLSLQNVREVQQKYHCTLDTSRVRSPAMQRRGSVAECTFENGMCGLTNGGDFAWQTRTGATPTHGTGPYADYTSGNGYYLYVEASGHLGQTARLYYNNLNSGVFCIDFWYYVYGSTNMASLIIGGEVNGHRQLMATVPYRGYNYWRHMKLTLTVPQAWKLFFEVTPTSDLGDIAIDNLAILPTECPQYEA